MFETFKLKKRSAELEDTVLEQKRQMTAIRLEWQDSLTRLNTLLARLAKASQRARELSEQEGAQGTEGGAPSSPESSTRLSTLSPRARLIQQQIEARPTAPPQGGGNTEEWLTTSALLGSSPSSKHSDQAPWAWFLAVA